ncbi:MAG: Potassium-transporting ATPase ATP-binding subunit [Legionella sp.]|uniref:heavy metal translocating P-type ATPase n=1 Tax=Legionella sp. TaxID=459 RepID=UPI003D0ED021
MTSFTPNRPPSDHMSKQKKNKAHNHHKHSHHNHSHDHHGHSHDHHHGDHHDNHWFKATLGLVWGASLLVLSVGGFSIPIAAYYAITGLTSLMTLYLGHTVYQSAWNSFRRECGLHLMSELSKEPSEYPNSYIFCKDELFYVNTNGESRKVKIDDLSLFKETLNEINGQNSSSLTLTTRQIKNLITANGGHTLPNNKWDMTTLYTISTLSILAVSIASILIPGLPMMFEAAPLVLGFWHLGEGIEHSLIDQINKKLDVLDCLPKKVLLKGEEDKKVSVKNLVPENLIVIQKGDVIPVDGVLTTDALLYTTRVDGSPELKSFKAGDNVKSGMRLAKHIPSLEMRVTKTYNNSYLSVVAKGIKEANDEKAPIELIANKILDYFIPGLLVTAAVSGVIIGSLFGIAPAIQCVISVLVSACPCALSLVTPMAVKIGMNKAAEQGIQFSNGAALQAAADIDTIVFDLNGTLTQGKMQVQNLQISDRKLLAHIALLERNANHPAAKTIAAYIQSQEDISDEPLEITDIDKEHHSGIKAVINGEQFIVGNEDMLLANSIMEINEPYNDPKNGSTYIVRGNTVIGQIALMDPLREDAITTIKQLKQFGKTVHICTGASQETAKRYATLLGIDEKNICANAVGVSTQNHEVSKISYIQELRNKGFKVAMVGDAANDSAAIAGAHIGIAVESKIGDNSAKKFAGIVVHQGLLFPIVTAFDLAQKGKQNIIQNYFVSLTYNSTITLVASGLFVALGFSITPPIGIALMVLETTVVLSNLYRFKQQDIVTTATQNNNTVDPASDDSPSVMSKLLGTRPQITTTLEEEPLVVNLFATNEQHSLQPTLQSGATYHY